VAATILTIGTVGRVGVDFIDANVGFAHNPAFVVGFAFASPTLRLGIRSKVA